MPRTFTGTSRSAPAVSGNWNGEDRIAAAVTGVWSRVVIGNENGRRVVARRPSHDWTNQGRGIAAVVLLPPATGLLIRRSGGQAEALAAIPSPDGRPTWFIHSSAAS